MVNNYETVICLITASYKGNMDGTTREALFQIQGIPLPERVVKYWARVEQFQASKEDLLIATYPKAGRVQKKETT